MALSLTANTPGSSADYRRYLYDQPVRTDRYNDSDLLDFTLAPIDSSFVPLTRGAYIVFDTATYPKWFTGFITSEPERVYLGGKKPNIPTWAYKIQASSDDYILNLSTVGVLPLIIGTTMGAFIKLLAEQLAPGFFDYTNVDDGPVLASYSIAPDKRFKEIVKDFCDSANFVFWANDKKLYFKQQDYTPSCLSIDGSSKHFTPANLSITPALNTIINDAVVIGDLEPQAYVDEYFVGNGFDAAFPLLTGVYGADNYTLLAENFGGNSISAQNWITFDNATNYLTQYNGYLNVIGGNAAGALDIYLKSAYPIQLEGNLRLTHGEYDFIPQTATSVNTGVICGLWTQAPNMSFTGCVFGILTQYDGGGVLGIYPIVNGVLDATQFVVPDTTGAKRYVIRTVANFNNMHRLPQSYQYTSVSGVVTPVAASSKSDTVFLTTFINEIDVTSGLLTNSWTWTNSGFTLASNKTFASYIPVASNKLHCTVTGISISVPLQASLEKATIPSFPEGSFDTWTSSTSPAGWSDVFNSVSQDTTDVSTGACCKLFYNTVSGHAKSAYIGKTAVGLIAAKTKYFVYLKALRSSGFTAAVSVSLKGTGVNSQFILPYTSLSTSFASFNGVLTLPISSIPADLTISITVTKVDGSDILTTSVTPSGSYVVVDNVIIASDWSTLLIGPNDINSLDGSVTTATITSAANSPQTLTQTGLPVYNSGVAQLSFFKDTALQTSTTPQPNELYRLSYRAAGNCYGRVQNKASIQTESVAWGDAGIRSISKQDLKPRPRNTVECQIAAASMVGQDGFQHYNGTVKVISNYSGGLPRAGTILQFVNLPSGMPSVVAEEIHEVKTTFLSAKPNEVFEHSVTFGEPDYTRKVLAGFSESRGSFAEYALGQQSISQVVDISNVGLTFAPDVVDPILYAWDSTTFYLDCNQTPPSGGGFEIRSSDAGWGANDSTTSLGGGKNSGNLIARLTGGTTKFTIPRQNKTRAIFIKAYDIRNRLLWSEDQTQANYTGVYVSSVMSRVVGPSGRLQNVNKLVLTSGQTNFVASNDSVASGTVVSCSVSVKGDPSSIGNAFVLGILNADKSTPVFGSFISTVLTGGWIRYTFTGTLSQTGKPFITFYPNGVGATVYVTQFSMEYGTPVETAYVQTFDTVYGATSQFPAAIRLAFPPLESIGSFVDTTLSADTINTNQFVSPPSLPVTVTATSVIVPDAFIKSLTSAAAVILTSIPIISAGVDGQQLNLLNSGSFAITIPCVTTLAGSTLVTSTDIVLAPNGSAALYYRAGTGWVSSNAPALYPSALPFTITPASGIAVINLINGTKQSLVLDGTAVTIAAPIWAGATIPEGQQFTLYLKQDATGNRVIPTFTGGANGFVSNTASQIQMDGTLSTKTTLVFSAHTVSGIIYWTLDSQQTGIALS